MKDSAPTRRRPHPSEEGYALLWVMFLLAALMIAMSVAAPKVAREIQRDREIETMQRGKQYIRGIKMYYKKFNAYPPSLDALVMTNNIRFLRKKYVDPSTGKEEWKAIHFGQNKAPTAMGFFGQPLAGSTLAGIGASGGNGVNGAAALGSSFMSSSNSPAGTNGASSTAGASAATASGTDSTAASAFGTSTSGQTFGGGGIIGFSPNSPKQSILVYKTKNHFNEWEFVYDPLAEQTLQGGNLGAAGQPVANPATTFGGSSTSGGSSTFGGSSIMGGSSTIGGSSSTPIQNQTPQPPVTPQ